MIQFRLKELIARHDRITGVKPTYRQLALATGLSTNTITRIARNDVSMVGLKTLDKLCEFFGCDLSDLIIRVPS